MEDWLRMCEKLNKCVSNGEGYVSIGWMLCV